ncbi:Holliday junction branch migration protein RuvA [Propylenella binzhouense]|uniref:Holliday junction branch migration complex subunit RuvA n=1 Tax=Propylenella binzhouense TaxID=2555902 RepID=A0A964T444_9HYPH|nr:Holliday junction branch migration protein RuvA [Propylenella binzhouense]MYZ48131.1 Holliday junction branch migration protein RuvA [Propylenella binzhouense]
MIGKLKGIVDSSGSDWVILDVHGVGYQVQCSARTLRDLPQAGAAATLFVETVFREDQIRLIGFMSEAERDWYRLLVTVQGVGSKVALAVLGTLSAAEFASAIAHQDKAMIARAPGVGPKVAARICAELKDRAPAFSEAGLGLARLPQAGAEALPLPASDAVSALVNLGYQQAQASAAVAAAIQAAGDHADTAQLIRLGLKELAR